MGGGDVIVNDGGELNSDIVPSHTNLLWDLADLNLDVYLNEFLGQRVDLDKTWVNSAVKTAEFSNQAHVSLGDGLIRVRTADT